MSGIENAFIAIAAEAFGLPEESVRVTTGDTASAPYGGVAGGSKVTYTYGRAVERAAEEAKQRLLDAAASELEIAPEDLEVADGEVRPVGAPARAISIADLAAKTYTFGGSPPPDRGLRLERADQPRTRRRRPPEPRQGGPRHRRGAPARPRDRPGRRQGAQPGAGRRARCTAARPRAWAGRCWRSCRTTRTASSKAGRSPSTRCPSTDQVPPIETLLIEVPAPDGPFGAKGVGEPPVCGVPAAIANGIAAATGIRLHVLPMTPVRVWAELQSARVV